MESPMPGQGERMDELRAIDAEWADAVRSVVGWLIVTLLMPVIAWLLCPIFVQGVRQAP